jgi:hypothetical protein
MNLPMGYPNVSSVDVAGFAPWKDLQIHHAATLA